MFRLLFGRAPVHSFGRTQSNPILHEMMDENEVWLNADVAARMGLATARYVRLRNQDGVVSNRVKLKATQRIRPDCVYMVHGFGHTAVRLRRALRPGRERRPAHHPVQDGPADGRHGHERQLRGRRGGGVGDGTLRHGNRHPPLRRLHGLRRRLQDREPACRRASTATGSRTETAGTFPDAAPGDPLRALQPLRQPALRHLLPDRRQPRGRVRPRRARHARRSASAARRAWRRARTTRGSSTRRATRTSARSASTA